MRATRVMRAMRVALGVVGVLAGLYGLWLARDVLAAQVRGRRPRRQPLSDTGVRREAVATPQPPPVADLVPQAVPHAQPPQPVAATAPGMRTVRVALGAVGVLAGLYGLWLVRDFDLTQLRSAVVWLVGGAVIHDGLLAPATVGLGLLATRWLPVAARRPAVVGFVLWGTLTVAAASVLSGMNDTPDNETLVDRSYWLSWSIGTVLVLAAVVAATLVARRRGVSRASNTRSD